MQSFQVVFNVLMNQWLKDINLLNEYPYFFLLILIWVIFKWIIITTPVWITFRMMFYPALAWLANFRKPKL